MAKIVQRVGQHAQVRLLIDLMVQLVFLRGQSVELKLTLGSAALVFGQLNHRMEIRLLRLHATVTVGQLIDAWCVAPAAYLDPQVNESLVALLGIVSNAPY